MQDRSKNYGLAWYQYEVKNEWINYNYFVIHYVVIIFWMEVHGW